MLDPQVGHSQGALPRAARRGGAAGLRGPVAHDLGGCCARPRRRCGAVDRSGPRPRADLCARRTLSSRARGVLRPSFHREGPPGARCERPRCRTERDEGTSRFTQRSPAAMRKRWRLSSTAAPIPMRRQQAGYTHHGCSRAKRDDLVHLLLARGANPVIVSDERKSAGAIGGEHGHTAIAARLGVLDSSSKAER